MTTYKVVEESLSPSGKIEYKTLPLYKQISLDEISGEKLFISNNSELYINSFETYEDAEKWMKNYFVGYTYVRPVIFMVESDDDLIKSKQNYQDRHDKINFLLNVCKSKKIKFIKPLVYMTANKICEYSAMSKPEKKKVNYSFAYEETEEDFNFDE